MITIELRRIAHPHRRTRFFLNGGRVVPRAYDRMVSRAHRFGQLGLISVDRRELPDGTHEVQHFSIAVFGENVDSRGIKNRPPITRLISRANGKHARDGRAVHPTNGDVVGQ